ncbi:MAG: F0F1 ATP synthase subunit delta [Akkermansia sp.]
MKISKDTQAMARRLLRLCLKDGLLLDDKVRQIVNTIVTRKPRNYIPLLSALTRLVKLTLDKRQVSVKSAIPLDEQTQTGIIDKLTQQYGQGLQFSWDICPELIAGIRIRVGDHVIDGSVSNRIKKINELVARL